MAVICIASQAPGLRVHVAGQPYTDASGARLKGWLGIGDDDFYDARKVAIVPMGFCSRATMKMAVTCLHAVSARRRGIEGYSTSSTTSH
jgi:uracil-DNA glycosylase